MNIVKLIKRIDDREAELLFKTETRLLNGDIVNFDAYSEIGGTASYINIENSIYVLDYFEYEFGVSAGLECIYGEERSLHLDAIRRKLDL